MLEFVKYMTDNERKIMRFLLINANIHLEKKRGMTQIDKDALLLSSDISNSINKIEIQNTGR